MAASLIGLLSTSTALGQSSPYDAAIESMKQRTEVERKAVAGNADRRVWDSVFADRKAKTVTLLACATTIKSTDPAEFFVTTLASGKDYEALTITPATPSDLRAALLFCKFGFGQPINPDQNRFWSRGPRLTMTMKIGGQPVRAEELILNTTTNKPLPKSGIIYTGTAALVDAPGVEQPMADDTVARNLAPTYNDPAALFDVPEQALQSAVYGFRKPAPAFTAKPGELVEITIAEAAGAEATEEWMAKVSMAVVGGKTRYAMRAGAASPNVIWDLSPGADDDLARLVAEFANVTTGTCDIFTKVHIQDHVPVADVRNLFAVLQTIENDRGVKLDAPPADELFYRAYFPDPAWRDRTRRLGEPWELHLSRDTARKITAKLERQVDNPDRDAAERLIVQSTIPADTAAFVTHVNANQSRWSRTIFVFPPPDLTYGELMAWVRPVLATYPRVFVFPAAEAATQPAK